MNVPREPILKSEKLRRFFFLALHVDESELNALPSAWQRRIGTEPPFSKSWIRHCYLCLNREKCLPTRVFHSPDVDMAMLFAPFGCILLLPPVPPSLFMQNLSPKDTAGYDIMKLKYMVHWLLKG